MQAKIVDDNIFYLKNDWEYHTIEAHIKLMDKFFKENNNKEISFDLSELTTIDSSGMVLLIRYIKLFESNNVKVNLINISNKY